jgi:hypothetical protein
MEVSDEKPTPVGNSIGAVLDGKHCRDGHRSLSVARDGTLFGFFYIQFTGVVTKDRYRVAEHVNCNGSGADCTVGWTLNGKPVKATFLYHMEHDHPVSW